MQNRANYTVIYAGQTYIVYQTFRRGLILQHVLIYLSLDFCLQFMIIMIYG